MPNMSDAQAAQYAEWLAAQKKPADDLRVSSEAIPEGNPAEESPSLVMPEASGGITADQMQAMIQQALDRQATQHKKEMDALRGDLADAVKAAKGIVPAGLIPWHGAGVGEEIAETWGLADQEMARVGDRMHALEMEMKG